MILVKKSRFDKVHIESFLKSEINVAYWEKLEAAKRLPWIVSTCASIQNYVRKNGVITPKQKTLIMTMYLESCVITDDEIQRQINTRKLCLQLTKMHGVTGHFFASDVMGYTHNRRFSVRQTAVIEDLYRINKDRIDDKTKFTDENFDGWHEKSA